MMLVLTMYMKALYIALYRDKVMFPASSTCLRCAQETSGLAERRWEQILPVKVVKNFVTWLVA